MSDMGSSIPIPTSRAGTFPKVRGGRLGGIIGLISNLDTHREEYLAYIKEMEKVKTEASALTNELSEDGCEQCVYTQGQVTLQNIEGWSDISIAYQFYICQHPIHFSVMKILEWTYGVAFDGFEPKECVLKESKANYDQFFDSNGDVKFFMTIKNFGDSLFMKQARAQNASAFKGMPSGKLEWYFMQPISAKYARIEFASEELSINVIYKPMPLDYIKNIFPD